MQQLLRLAVKALIQPLRLLHLQQMHAFSEHLKTERPLKAKECRQLEKGKHFTQLVFLKRLLSGKATAALLEAVPVAQMLALPLEVLHE